MPLPCLICPCSGSCFLFCPARDFLPSGSKKARGAGGLSPGDSPWPKRAASSRQIRSGSRRTSGTALGLFLGRSASFLEGATRAAAPCGASAVGWPPAGPLDRPPRAPFFFDAADRFPRFGMVEFFGVFSFSARKGAGGRCAAAEGVRTALGACARAKAPSTHPWHPPGGGAAPAALRCQAHSASRRGQGLLKMHLVCEY